MHVAARLDARTWVLEVRRPGNDGPQLDLAPGTPGRAARRGDSDTARPVPRGGAGRGPAVASPRSRAFRTACRTCAGTAGAIAYGYLRSTCPADRQTVFARHPGSAEMPSAGRPFTERLVVDLVTRGVAVAPVVLHCGVSSPELSEPPAPERYTVPPSTARLVNAVSSAGGRVVAVGHHRGPGPGDLRVPGGDGHAGRRLDGPRPRAGPTRPSGDGSGHGLARTAGQPLLLLEAVAGRALVDEAYAAVTAGAPRYLWHEFGDAMILLP